MIYVVVSTQIDGAQHGVALQVPDGWLEDPTKAEQLMYGAVMSFRQHVHEKKLRLLPGHDIDITFEEM